MKYIHYGHDNFDISKFDNISNISNFTKPAGGFWASRVDAEYGWKDWCLIHDFKTDLEKCFEFSLTESAKILTINDSKQLMELPKVNSNIEIKGWDSLDFEQLSQMYDAIEVMISEDDELYFKLIGWDCDSILIMNPNIIIEE